MAVATICSPGFYRRIEFDDDGEEVDGLPCRACPQGSWSKNWELREVGECSKCPTGVVCSVDAMTVPCNRGDLPTPYEPVGNLDGAPVTEYLYASYNSPTKKFTEFECLNQNPGYQRGTMRLEDQIFFYGELVPPFIDVLGEAPISDRPRMIS